MKRLHAIVEGRVQGVGFRAFVITRAHDLRLTGWVRNLSADAVEIVAEGEDVALARLELLLQKGPPLSRVDNVRNDYSTPTGEFTGFHVRSDA